MVGIAVWGYFIAFAVLALRFALVVHSGWTTWYDQQLPVYRYLLVGKGFWTYLFQLMVDLTVTFGLMAATRLVIAGSASAPIGAVLGILISMSINGVPWYGRRVRKKMAS